MIMLNISILVPDNTVHMVTSPPIRHTGQFNPGYIHISLLNYLLFSFPLSIFHYMLSLGEGQAVKALCHQPQRLAARTSGPVGISP